MKKSSCIVRVLAAIGVLFFVGAASLPWYVEVIETDLLQTSVASSATQFWYTSNWRDCDSCDLHLEVEFWEFGDNQEVRAVFGISWALSVLALFSTFGVMLSGKAGGSVGVIITSILAIGSFFFITPAFNDDALLCNGGPCDSFAGIESLNNTTYYWGPSLGWYAAVIGLLWMIMVLIVGTCCCLLTSCSKRAKYQELSHSHYEAPPVKYTASTTATFHQPTDANGNYYTTSKV